jgi:hypothetical protein
MLTTGKAAPFSVVLCCVQPAEAQMEPATKDRHRPPVQPPGR